MIGSRPRPTRDGSETGGLDALAPWEQTFFPISVAHCEGSDHLTHMQKLKALTEALSARQSDPIAPAGEQCCKQIAWAIGVIERFGRPPHRTSILGRLSTPEEEA
mgnify:CR=1 FL=1